jgi:hypothetical protein
MTISISKAVVGGSENSWGPLVNNGLDTIVDALNGVSESTPDLTEGSWKVGGTAISSSAEEINKLDGLTASTAELNKMDGVSSNIQTQLDSKLGGSNSAATITTLTSTTIDLGDWTISQVGSSLKFKYNGTARFALSSTGALTVENDVTAFGSA